MSTRGTPAAKEAERLRYSAAAKHDVLREFHAKCVRIFLLLRPHSAISARNPRHEAMAFSVLLHAKPVSHTRYQLPPRRQKNEVSGSGNALCSACGTELLVLPE